MGGTGFTVRRQFIRGGRSQSQFFSRGCCVGRLCTTKVKYRRLDKFKGIIVFINMRDCTVQRCTSRIMLNVGFVMLKSFHRINILITSLAVIFYNQLVERVGRGKMFGDMFGVLTMTFHK